MKPFSALPEVALVAQKLKMLADPTRLSVLCILLSGPRNVSEINSQLRLEPTLLSHHLRVLRTAGFVEAVREGKFQQYQLTQLVRADNRGGGIVNLGTCSLQLSAGLLPTQIAAESPAPTQEESVQLKGKVIAAALTGAAMLAAPASVPVLAPATAQAVTLALASYNSGDAVITDGSIFVPLGNTGNVVGPLGIAVGSDDRLYVALFNESGLGAIRVQSAPNTWTDFVPNVAPLDLAFAPAARTGTPGWGEGDLFVTQFGTNLVSQYDTTGASLGTVAVPNLPSALTFAPDGQDLFIASSTRIGGVNQLYRYDGTNVDTITADLGFQPGGLAFGPDGFLYASVFDSGGQVARINPATGAVLDSDVLVGPTEGDFYAGLWIDPNNGDFYIATLSPGNIVRYAADGSFQGVFFDGAANGLFAISDVTPFPIPEPGTVALLGGAVLALGVGSLLRRRKPTAPQA